MSLTAQEQKAVQAFKESLQKYCGKNLMELRLFGSRARGEGHEESDVDILVLLQNASSKDRNFIYGLPADIFLEYEINVSPLVMSQEKFQELKDRERLLAKEIERDGVKL
ncbi:MAG: nucleotidyltransferase domain-containing protein [Deltaproteobacteria bacterium]|nr:nucleotidyltransferase domain-containing protein [Deltaproteobacteria bacterium]